ncbi:glycosyltransferase [Actinomyces sp. 2119]|uniref:glycosyltransferase n=1 Tax=Actinomyces sp. 2119 TaxID=2321393 RepID=UPI002175A913|nr:glycosyltransferase [Actinomyces sp. 2119]
MQDYREVPEGRARPLMIFHAPYPLVERAAASRLRPVRMRQAFEALGFEVVTVAGYASQRRRAMRRALHRVDQYLFERGHLPDDVQASPMPFLYSENATIPSALTEPRHMPVHPRLDTALFSRLIRRGVAVGSFYRDLYWRFPRFRQGIHPAVDNALKAAYTAELWSWRRLGVQVYLPSQAMAPHLPVIRPERIKALPPGADPQAVSQVSRPRPGSLELLFIGVLGDNYVLDAVAEAVGQVPQVRLTLCVRQETWQATADHYAPLLPPGRHEVIHTERQGLEPLYERASLGVLLVEPSPYWDFAVPYKLYEYLAHELPVVATAGTETGRIVEELGIGWTLPYSAEALAALLRRLADNPGERLAVQERMRQVLAQQTWQARARQVAADLSPRSLDLLDSPDSGESGESREKV